MSQPAPSLPFDLRELRFALFDWLEVSKLFGAPPYEDFSDDVVALVLEEALKLAGAELAPANLEADRIGARFVDGRVALPDAMKRAWAAFRGGGWHLLGVAPSYGGQGFPHALSTAVDEMMMAACPSFAFYPLLSRDTGRMIDTHGTPEQKARFAQRLFDAEWCGTMCLTEPDAGSDVGASTTRAVPQADGSYLVSGSKCFITAADHDLTDNIIHLVLARTPDAASGTKGLSLFIVPKRHVDADGGLGGENDVQVDGIEKKMGIHGSATCSVTFGREGRCRGWLLGDAPFRGIAQMFQMMNDARIDVGTSGAAVAGASYQAALGYAKTRIQGSRFEAMGAADAPKVPILEHPDVRRMLLTMKSSHESLRALCLWTAHQKDLARLADSDTERSDLLATVELMTPVLKYHCTEVGFQMASVGISVLGGYGYCRDYPLEQHCRDAKIGTIYEGTNHIQALDLVGRKLPMQGGRPFERFLARIDAAAREADGIEALAAAAAQLRRAAGALVEARGCLLEALGDGRLALVPLSANRFCEMMGTLASAWVLLEQATVASRRLETPELPDDERAFLAGKVASARFYAASQLPSVLASLEVIRSGELSAVEIDAASF